MKTGSLLMEFDAELLDQINGAAHDQGQTPEALVTELVVSGLKDQQLWGQARKTLAELSPRALEVARLTAAGLTNEEIATALTVSPNTVKSHIRRILMKSS